MEHDKTLAKLAIHSHFITEEQAQECLLLQQQYIQQKADYIPLTDILREKKIIADDKVETLKQKYYEHQGFSLSRFFYSANFKRYIIEKELGRGGMGVVYKAYDSQLKRHVALKMIIKENYATDQVERFIKEAQVLAKFSHQNIVTIFDVNNDPPFFTMEFIDGASLAQKIAQNKLSIEESLQILLKVCEAITYLHNNQILHRDLKPENIMVDNNGRIIVMDFGLAKEADASSMEWAGTLGYMSPEQAAGEKIDVRSDLYSLGVILYKMLTKELPFKGTSPVNVLYQQAKFQAITPSFHNKDVSDVLEAICLHAIETIPENRYSSVENLRKDIYNYLHHLPISIIPYSAVQKFVLHIKRNPTVFALSACIGVLVLCIPFMWQNNPQQTMAKQKIKTVVVEKEIPLKHLFYELRDKKSSDVEQNNRIVMSIGKLINKCEEENLKWEMVAFRSDLYLDLKEYQAAINDYQSLLDTQYDNKIEIQIKQALCYKELKKTDKAKQILESLLGKNLSDEEQTAVIEYLMDWNGEQKNWSSLNNFYTTSLRKRWSSTLQEAIAKKMLYYGKNALYDKKYNDAFVLFKNSKQHLKGTEYNDALYFSTISNFYLQIFTSKNVNLKLWKAVQERLVITRQRSKEHRYQAYLFLSYLYWVRGKTREAQQNFSQFKRGKIKLDSIPEVQELFNNQNFKKFVGK